MPKKYISAKDAKVMRENSIAFYSQINCNVKPTKGVDSGAKGKIFELQNARDDSRKTRVSKECNVDNHFMYEGRMVGYESKTNGGIVQKAINALEDDKNGFIVYSLDICNKGTNYKQRTVPPVIMRYDQFIALLEDTGALRPNTKTGEGCIQSSSKALYLRLLDYPLTFDKTQSYTADDFDGLEI